MKNKWFKKGLAIGIIVSLLVIAVNSTIGKESQSVNLTDKKQTIDKNIEENYISDFLGNGIILFHTLRWEHGYRRYVSDPWIKLNCEDLDTGEIKHITTNSFGFRIKFFPRGHDFKISVPLYNIEDKIIEDLGFFKHVKFHNW